MICYVLRSARNLRIETLNAMNKIIIEPVINIPGDITKIFKSLEILGIMIKE
jgi:hypothetical protein